MPYQPSANPLSPITTIVITTHNRPEWLTRAIESALAQTVDDIEILVIDDGSEPPATVERYHDDRVKLYRRDQAGGGPCRARNVGIERASGTMVMFLDDDDWLEPDFLERSLAAIEASTLPPPVASLCAQRVLDDDGNTLGHRLPPTTQRGVTFHTIHQPGRLKRVHPTLVAPTEVLRSIGGFDPAFGAAEYSDLFIRLAATCSLQGHDHLGYNYQVHDGPRASRRDLEIAESRELLVAKHRDRFGRATRSQILTTASKWHLRAGNRAPAARTGIRAFLERPNRSAVRATARAVVGAPPESYPAQV